MKTLNIIKFALDDITKNSRKYFLWILVTAFSLIVLTISLLSYNGSAYSYNSLNENLSGKIEKTGVLRFFDPFNQGERIADFVNSLQDYDKIVNIGYCSLGGTYGMTELKKYKMNI